jgi:hypothetical protein
MNEPEIETTVVKDRRAANPYRRPFLILVTVICISLLAQAFGSWQTWRVADDTNKIVQDVDLRNSPESAARQQSALEEIILRVDCNSRKAIEEALNDISSENPGLTFNINITTERCGDTAVADPDE